MDTKIKKETWAAWIETLCSLILLLNQKKILFMGKPPRIICIIELVKLPGPEKMNSDHIFKVYEISFEKSILL